jgi:hypothetical protein
MTIADGGYPGTGLVMVTADRKGEELPDRKQAHNRSHKQVRARVEHVCARMKTWKILRDCRLKRAGAHYPMIGLARLHNLNLAGQASGRTIPTSPHADWRDGLSGGSRWS